MRLAYLLRDTSTAGGIERIVVNKMNYLVEKGYEVYLITTDGKKNKSFYNINSRVKVIDLNINYHLLQTETNILIKLIGFLKKHFKHGIKLKKVVKEKKIDILISTGAQDKRILPFLRIKTKKIREIHSSFSFLNEQSKIGRERETVLIKKLRELEFYFEKKFLNNFDKVIILNKEELVEYFKFIKNQKVAVIENYITIPKKVKDKNKISNRLVSVGRLEYEKGYDLLIDIWGKVNKQTNKANNWTLHIYGEGSQKNKLQEKIKQLGLEKSVKLKGQTKEIEKVYLESDIYLLPSRTEGIPMVILEALSYNLPCICFNCSNSIKNLISNGENGFVVDRDNVEHFSEKVAELISDNKEIIQMRKQTRLNLKNYTQESVMRKWCDLFEELKRKTK